MKKVLSLILAAAAALSLTANPLFVQPNEANLGTPVKMENVKKATPELQNRMVAKSAAKLRAAKKAPNFPVQTINDLKGNYTWTYNQYTGSSRTTDFESVDAASRETGIQSIATITINDQKAYIDGLFAFPVTATLGTSGNYTTLTLDVESDGSTQVGYHSTYGPLGVVAVWYYEGDDTYSAGWYYGDITLFVLSDGIIFDTDVQFSYIITSGTYANYRLGWYTEPGSTLVPNTEYNGIMSQIQSVNLTSSTTENRLFNYAVKLAENEDYVVSIEGFGGFDATINAQLNEDKTFVIAPQVVLNNATYGDFFTSDATAWYNNNFAVADITGTGTENLLTFDNPTGGYTVALNGTGRWYGQRFNAEIELLEGEFAYPEAGEKLYILGEVNGNSWDPSVGVEMTQDPENEFLYTATVTLDRSNLAAPGLKVDNTPGVEYCYFSFTEKLADNPNDWASIADYRIGAVSEKTDDNPNGDFRFYKEMLGQPISMVKEAEPKAIQLAEGTYTFYFYKSDMCLVIEGESKTAIDDINANNNVVATRYYNLAGVESAVPFQGVNIVVNTMSDGTKVATKVVK